MLQVGDAEKFPQEIGFESSDFFFSVSKPGPYFTTVEEDGGDKRLVARNLIVREADVILPPDPV